MEPAEVPMNKGMSFKEFGEQNPDLNRPEAVAAYSGYLASYREGLATAQGMDDEALHFGTHAEAA